MIEPTVDIDLREVFAGLDEFEDRARDLRPVYRDLVPLMKQDQREHHRLREGPDGPWPKLARSTRRKRRQARRRGRRPPRGALGQLRTAFKVQVEREELAAETRVDWSGAHQDGAVVGRGVKLPKRVHRFMSAEFLAIAHRKIEEHVFGRWGKRRA